MMRKTQDRSVVMHVNPSNLGHHSVADPVSAPTLGGDRDTVAALCPGFGAHSNGRIRGPSWVYATVHMSS